MIVCVPPTPIDPEAGVSVNGSSKVQEKSMGTSPSLVTTKVLTPVSAIGQKPKSRLVGTWLEICGIAAPMGTTNDPFSVRNSTTSSYSSRRMGRKWTSSTLARPGVSLIVSGKAIEKYFDSGSRYLIFITRVLTFFTTSCFVYSPPGCHPAFHSSRSAGMSTPKRRTRSARVSGAGLTDDGTDESVGARAGSCSSGIAGFCACGGAARAAVGGAIFWRRGRWW